MNQQSGSLCGTDVGHLSICHSCIAWFFCGTPNGGWGGVVSDSFAYFWDPFPPTGLPFPGLIWEKVPRLIAT